MSVIAIIPARMGSTRLANKPLLKETGKYLIQHVVEQVRKVKAVDRVIVATDDERVVAACGEFEADAVMTRPDHPSGTDRIAEVADRIGLADDAIVVNVQGDEPEISPRSVSELIELLGRSDDPMATLATPLRIELAEDPSKVKVVFDLNGRALYFSRAKIPYDRDSSGEMAHYLHLGVYAYRAGFLKLFTTLGQTPAELAEKLEQLRALEHG
ncbi:MAG: 3-deoxy-manno-octulosonate cytidylyltransferase, partial [Planctomycetes bacterium]|nr:3-deoxy-manno-octulosonate cytidylyltransferase [Planctomycetota bacterium]